MGTIKLNFKIVLFLIILLVFSNFSYAEEVVTINYFTTDACLSCAKTNKYMEILIKELEAENIMVEVINYDIMDNESDKLFVQYNNSFGVEKDKYKLIPAIFIEDVALIGSDDIEANIKDTIINFHKNPKNIQMDVEGASQDSTAILTTTGIALAGLIDGINPCSIAMMLFFISFVFVTDEKKIKILLLGGCFALGTFVAYLGIGIGLFNFINLFKNVKLIMKGFYISLAIMGAYLAYLNISDYINIKNGKEEKIKNQLNRKTKKKIHSLIKKNRNDSILYLTAFVTAFMISFLEFFCTGQIYLPVITYMIKNTESLNYIFLLVLYNLAFIVPLMVIAVLMHLGREVIDISTVLVNKLHLVKLMGALFFIAVAIYSGYQLILI